jgi:hypothetical protein
MISTMISNYTDILIIVVLAVVPFLALFEVWLIRRNRERRVALRKLGEDFDDIVGDSDALRDDKQPVRSRFFGGLALRIGTATYYLLLICGIALFYHNATVRMWRIRRNLIRSGITQSINIDMSGGDATLTGNIATRRLAIRVSRRAAEIVGAGHVVNELEIEEPVILGSDSDPLGEAEVAVNTAYDDSPESLRGIGAILNLPQFETVNVVRGTTLPGLIAQRYGIARSRLPKSFAMLAAEIRKLNALNPSEDLHLGTLNVPILPTRYAGQSSRAVRAGQKQEPGFVDLLPSGLIGALQRVGIGRNLHPIGSDRVLLKIPFTRGTAEQTQKVATVLPFSILSSSMRIEFASVGGGAGLHEVLNDKDKIAIVNALKQERQRVATVFILDAGWPDETAYRTSLAELRRLVDQARDFYDLDAVHWEAPMTTEEFSKTEPPQHCVYIQRALKEFTDLDRDHAVKVIYVPLSRRQKSDQILIELLTVYSLRDKLANDNHLTPDRKITLSNQAKAWATGRLSGLHTNAPDMPDAPQSEETKDSYQQTWETDSSIVTAVWYLADLDSYRHTDRPVYFLNESWTVLPDKIHFASPDRSYGIVVAAVGNAANVVVNRGKGQIEFARLATPANNVLAALDAKQDSDDPDCDSSMLAEADLNRTMAAGFDGNVTDGNKTEAGVCGSSFSAPRIAWILALSETIRTKYQEKDDWANSVQQKLLEARGKGSTHQWQKLYLHPTNVLP